MNNINVQKIMYPWLKKEIILDKISRQKLIVFQYYCQQKGREHRQNLNT